jgi:hypothetical protein
MFVIITSFTYVEFLLILVFEFGPDDSRVRPKELLCFKSVYSNKHILLAI